ncbi:hypothetical protein EI74_0042 [Mycoplasma testudineum]|uniref:Lipoprotein n=1 Tax=Mycoplasma testudineum TaxID=244584 RepID=A0A4V3C3H8_9MOLU|nr:hypothetical protein [Mycoplasma testudineum]OYD26423.1 hypothetical protein CG473_04010 [Mycoplasma testudineum]TDO22098.1 hypothetical protein EI74_0042 [Mycoplasma testudineum]
MKKFKLLKILPLTLITTAAIAVSCNQHTFDTYPNLQEEVKYTISEVENKQIAALLEKTFNKIKTVDETNSSLELDANVNNEYWLGERDRQYNFHKKPSFKIENGDKKIYYGFLNTIKNMEDLNKLSEKQINELIKNKLIIEGNNPDYDMYKRTLWGSDSYNKIISSFDDFKHFLSYTKNWKDDSNIRLDTEEGIDYLSKLKNEKINNLKNFNSIDANYFKDNLILLTTTNIGERIVDMQFNPKTNTLNIQTMHIQIEGENFYNWTKLVNDLEIWTKRITTVGIDYPTVVGWNHHEQHTKLTVINKKQYGISDSSDIKVKETVLDNYFLLTNHYLNK